MTVDGASHRFGGSNGHNEISRNEHTQGLICNENGFIIPPSTTCLTETYVASFSPILLTTSKLARYRWFSKRWFYCALWSRFRLLSSRFRWAFFYCTPPPLLWLASSCTNFFFLQLRTRTPWGSFTRRFYVRGSTNRTLNRRLEHNSLLHCGEIHNLDLWTLSTMEFPTVLHESRPQHSHTTVQCHTVHCHGA